MKIDAKMPAHVDLILYNAFQFFNWSDTLAAPNPQLNYDALLGLLKLLFGVTTLCYRAVHFLWIALGASFKNLSIESVSGDEMYP